MRLQLILLLNLFALTQAIINGTDAPRNEFPYMVSLQWDGKHKCGGTLLNKNTVLTAAHCYPLIYVDPQQPEKASALIGTSDQTSSGGFAQRRTLGKSIWLAEFPEKWKKVFVPVSDDSFASVDYLIIKLDGPDVLESKTIKYAKLSNRTRYPRVGDFCTLIGWGRSRYPDTQVVSKNDFPARLQQGQVVVLSQFNPECYEEMKLRPWSICVKQRRVAGRFRGLACFGDSGGPMECERNGIRYVAGITHAAVVPCNYPEIPAIYLSIRHKIDWIKANM